MVTATDTLTIWLEAGVPKRLVWNGARYRVSDRPTPLEDSILWVTHPPAGAAGWRFQGTADDGRTRMFDVRQKGNDWVLVRSYE